MRLLVVAGSPPESSFSTPRERRIAPIRRGRIARCMPRSENLDRRSSR